MKRLLLLLPLGLLAHTLPDILHHVDHSGLLKAKKYEVLAKRRLYEAAKAKNLFSIDASLQGVWLHETPTMSLHLSLPDMPPLPSKFQAAAKEQYTGELAISYPIFTGFAITNLIQKSRLDLLKTRLEKRDLKRRLYLKASALYGQIYALEHTKKALHKALEAMELSYRKAKGFYAQGLIPLSDLKNIEAKRYEIEAKLQEIKAATSGLYQELRYLSGLKIRSIDGLPNVALPKPLDVTKRADVQALKKALAMDRKDVALAKSALYPKLFVKGAVRGYGDDLSLSGDGYRNGDQSYAAVVMRYNLFNGFGDKAKIEAARAKFLAKRSFLDDYIKRARTQLRSDQLTLRALESKRVWAKKRVEAARSYYELIKGRYDNQLASADELSRSIASLAEARAQLAGVRSRIFVQKCKIALQVSLEHFVKELGL